MEITSIKKPINIYVHSTDVKMVVDYALLGYNGELEQELWPFEVITLEVPTDLKEVIPQRNYTPAFSQFKYIEEAAIRTELK